MTTIRMIAPLKAAFLAGTALLMIQHSASVLAAEPLLSAIVLAQADQDRTKGRRDKNGKPDGERDKPAKPEKRDEPTRQPPAAEKAPDTQQQKPAAQQERKDERRDQRRDERAIERRPQAPAAAQADQDRKDREGRRDKNGKPDGERDKPAIPAKRDEPTRQPPAAEKAPDTQQQKPAAQQERKDERRDQRRDERAIERRPQAPAEAQPQRQPTPPAAQDRRPGAQQSPAAAQTASPTVVAPPTQARDAREFIRRSGDAPSRGMDQVRRERREVREDDRVVIREQDRAIVREGGRTIIRHNESSRFAIGARGVSVDRRGGTVETVVERGNGVRIVSVHDADGRLVRRVRRDLSGRDVVIINNSFAGRRAGLFLQLQAPTVRIPREHYIVDMDRSRPDDVYAVFMAAPVERLERRYTLDQVRYNAPLRAYMPRVDLDVNFETGSWQITPDQIGKLEVIARGIMRSIAKNPLEVFLVEGHTDAVGSDDDNLSLSDRRAESVAIVLTEEFRVPPENLVTQGYGEQELKVDTDGPSRENRRVAVRRITPLLDQQVDAR